MSLARRLRILEERARQDGLLTREPPCPCCGGPDPLGHQVAIVDVGKGEELGHCPACNREVDQDGRALGEHASVVYLHHEAPDVPLPAVPT